MKKISTTLFISIIAVLTTGAVFLARADTREYTLDVEGSKRTFHVHVPEKIIHPVPLIIALHGGGSNGKSMESFSGLSESADKYGFIVVYPDGTGRLKRMLTWNGGECCGYAQQHQIDDTTFIRNLIDHMIKQYGVDPSRVYVTGISNGAIMAYRLAAEIPEKLAAVAAVSGSLEVDPKTVRKRIPVLHFHGTEDQYIPFEGGHGRRSLEKTVHRSVLDTIKVWVNINDTFSMPLEEELPDRFEDGTRITRYTYKAKHNNDNVILYKIIGGGHTWPGRPRMKFILGTTTMEISANDVMWKFFSGHPKSSVKDKKEDHVRNPADDRGM